MTISGGIPSSLTAGDTLSFDVVVPAREPGDGWSLSYRLVPRAAGGTVLTFSGSAAASGSGFSVLVPAATTAAWAAGDYSAAGWVSTVAGLVYTVETAQIAVAPNPRSAAAGTDTRSPARRALEDARAAFAAWSPVQKRYRIADREREFNSPADILVVLRYWEQQVANEERLAGRAESIGRRIYSRI